MQILKYTFTAEHPLLAKFSSLVEHPPWVRHPLKLLFLTLLSVSCGSDDGGGPSPEPEPVAAPGAATLIFPEDNTECNEGEIVSDTESAVTFRWEASENTDAYNISLTNLNDGTSRDIEADGNERSITILRGTPYEWSVTSTAGGTSETAVSSIWKFYNAGAAIESHPPFPASAVFPTTGSAIGAGTVALTWEASDVDNDIASYEIFIDENNPPETLLGTPITESIDFDATAGNVYYWRVKTLDAIGNTSNSDVFQFKVN